jgi:CRP/FNR family cyclic AMP-dependent transcriptional regulator
VSLDVSVEAFQPIDRQTARRAGLTRPASCSQAEGLRPIDYVQGAVPAISTLSSRRTIDRFGLRCIDSRANVRQKANKISAGASDAAGRVFSCDSFKNDKTPIGNGPIGSLTRRPGTAPIIGEPISPIDEVLSSPMTVSMTRATGSPFLSPEAGAALEKICKLGVERSFAAGEYLYRQGDPPSSMHCTLSGRVRVFINRPDGSERILAFAGPRTTFGEFGIFDDFPCPTSAVAIKPSRVLVIDRAAIIEAGKVVPEILLEVARRLAQKTRLMSMHIAIDGLPVRKRVAMVLVHLLDAYGVVGPNNAVRLAEWHRVDDLANLIGVTRVTVSRELSRLVAKKVVVKGKREIVILNMAALRAAADDCFV